MNAARRGPSFGNRPRSVPTRWTFGFITVASFGAVAAALVSQYAFDMQPCPWCVLQRLLFIALGLFGLFGLVGWLWVRPAGARLAGIFALMLSAAGFVSSMWQHFVAAKSASCNLTLADRIVTATHLDALLPQVFEARASCADAAVNLLGVPYDFWAAALFALCAIAAVRALRLSA